MRYSINRNISQRPALAVFFLFALVCTASLGAQHFKVSGSSPVVFVDGPTRIKLTARAKYFPALPPGAKDLEFDFTAANGAVTQLSATSGKQTFKFERADNGDLSCPRGRVKECDSLTLQAGGQLTACACVPPGPVTQTKEHILLARQVGVPSMMTESSRPETIAAGSASSETSYEVALSDKTILRATSDGGQTCWINKKLPLTLCY